jgi:hypothetical protein
VVEAGKADAAERIVDLHDDAGLVLEQRQLVDGRGLEIVDLAGQQRVHRRRLVGEIQPFDAIDIGDLAAGGGRRRLVARHVVLELGVDGLGARHPLVGLELERARIRYSP